MANRIELHTQLKAFYSIVFNSSYDIRTAHVSLYMFLLNQNNRNMWVEWFKCPFDLAMQGALISSKTTYYKTLDDLVRFKLIEYEKGINTFKSPKIKILVLSVSNNDIVTVPQSEQVTVPQSEQVTVLLNGLLSVPLPVHIYKLITNNLKLITDNIIDFENSISNLGKYKNKKEFDLSFIDPEFEIIFKRWLNYKKEIKDYYKSQDSVEQAYKNLLKLSFGVNENAVEIVENSIGSGYKGLFPLKQNNQKSEPESKAAKTLSQMERVTMEKVEQTRREEALQNS